MTQATGGNAYIAYCEETTWGTTPATPSMNKLAGVVAGESLASVTEDLVSGAITGARARAASRRGNKTVSGSVPFELNITAMATLLKHALGPVVTTGASAPYTHTIKRGALPPGLTIEKGFADIASYFVYRGCRVESMTVQVGTQGLVTGDIAFVAKSEDAYGTPLDATLTEVEHNPLAHFDAVFTRMDGATPITAQVLSVNFSLSNGLDPQRVVGSANINSLREGMGEVTATLTVLFENDDHIAMAEAGTEFETKLVFTDAVTGDSLEFLLPRSIYSGGDNSPKISTEKGIVLTLPIRGLYDTTTGTDLQITVINDAATI